VSTAVLCLALCAVASANGNAAANKTRIGPNGTRLTTILGAAWHADNTPIPGARLRLRNLHSGRLIAHTVANDSGRFVFDSIEGGSYVIELVSESGKVLATGQSFAVAPGETIATFVRLASRGSWFTEFLSNAAAAAITTASSLGVTAVGNDARDVSPDGRPPR
jgi:hypothetical protein